MACGSELSLVSGVPGGVFIAESAGDPASAFEVLRGNGKRGRPIVGVSLGEADGEG